MKFPSFKKSLGEELLTWWGVRKEQISTVQPMPSMSCSVFHNSIDNLSDPQLSFCDVALFSEALYILRCLKIACSLIFRERTEEQG